MAILAIFKGNITKSQYEAVRKEVDWERQQPQGGMFHAVGFDDAGGIHIADIWESPEAMNLFFEKRLMPVLQKLKVPPPEASVYPAHNINVFKSIEKYKI